MVTEIEKQMLENDIAIMSAIARLVPSRKNELGVLILNTHSILNQPKEPSIKELTEDAFSKDGEK